MRLFTNISTIGYCAAMVFAALVLPAAPARAQAINGSLTGPIANTDAPPGWTTGDGFFGVDTMDQTANTGVPGLQDFAAPASPSPNGGTWVGMVRDTGFLESFGQTLTGLSVGQTYTVSWEAANFGYASVGYTEPNSILAQIDGASIGSGAALPCSTGWFLQSASFTATQTSHALSLTTGIADHRSYMSIDGILVAIPEPATAAIFLTAVAFASVQRRRRPNCPRRIFE